MKADRQKWLRLEENGWHIVIPEADSKPHGFPKDKLDAELAWQDCPCKPKINYLEKTIAHNSFIDEERIEQSLTTLEAKK